MLVAMALVVYVIVPVVFSQSSCPSPSRTTKLLMSQLNLSYPGLEAVNHAVKSGDEEGACSLLCQYYRDENNVPFWRRAPRPPGTGKVGGTADDALKDKYDFYGEVGVVPRYSNGSLDWHYEGPIGDDEYMYALNRHEIFMTLVDAYQATGNDVYSHLFDNLTTDWIASNPYSEKDTFGPWRSLESGIRMDESWGYGFFGFQHVESFRNSSRLAMVSSFGDHGEYLAQYAAVGNANFRSMQYLGLATVALVFPELQGSAAWYREATEGVLKDMGTGVYPDGVETEQTSLYHYVATRSFDGFRNITDACHHYLDPNVRHVVEGMFNYLAYCMDQNGNSPLNSDADLQNLTEIVLDAAKVFERDDWVYVATNGLQGTKPENMTSMFPWSGQFIMRDGWSKENQWAWLDVGPYGSSGHGHRDKLHLSIRIANQHLLVDSGRFSYNGPIADKFRGVYVEHTRAHNAFLIDGQQQVDTPGTVKSPLPSTDWAINPSYDMARASITFENVNGSALHTRAVRYERGRYWVVVDRITSDQARDVTAIWHAHPSCTVSVGNNEEKSHYGAGSDTVHIVGNTTNIGLDILQPTASVNEESSNVQLGQFVNTSVVIGQSKPVPQGWYSVRYNTYTESPAVVYNGKVNEGQTDFIWLLAPKSSKQSVVSIVSHSNSSIVLSITFNGTQSSVTIPMQ
eukprot:m.4202 g.4202  ORF g.4202 m.4202 type:complete len:684 (+) comp2922_c0_seq1:124-2175(+)